MDAAGPILLCAGDLAAVEDVGRSLEQAGLTVRHRLLADESAFDDRPGLILVEGRRYDAEALHFCRRWLARPANGSVPLLFILGDGSPAARLAALDAGADEYLLRPFASRELLDRVQALLRNHQLERRLTEKAAEAHQIGQRLRQAYRQIDQDLAAVRQLQRRFLPRALPQVPGLTLAVHYHPCGQVGGDCYDAFRLDERHVGFYLADALGHGTAAGLLTMFLQRAVRGKEVNGSGYHLLPPDVVLRRLNRELMEQALADVPFVTMIYGLYDCRERVLCFARAGHPHPLYVPRNGVPELWPSPGNLLGVFSTDYEVQTRTLNPGDKVLVYTDGIGPAGEEAPDRRFFLEAVARHRNLPVRLCVEQLAQDLLTQANPADDFTLLGMEISSM